MSTLRLMHPDHPELSWEIVHFNKETGTVRLKGHYAEIEQTFDKDKWTSQGYKIVRDEVKHAEQPRVQEELHAGVGHSEET